MRPTCAFFWGAVGTLLASFGSVDRCTAAAATPMREEGLLHIFSWSFLFACASRVMTRLVDGHQKRVGVSSSAVEVVCGGT